MCHLHQGCAVCSLQKDRVERRVPVHPFAVSYSLEVIGIDFLTLVRPADSYQNILVTTYLFMHFSWAIPTRDQTAQTTVKALWANVI